MAGYIGTQAVSVNTTSATISDDLSVGDDLTVTDDATIGGTLGVTGVVTANAGVVVDNITIDGNDISTTNTNGGLSLSPNGTGNITANTDKLLVKGTEGESATLALAADEIDDNGDLWQFVANTGNTLTIENDINGGTSTAQLTITPNATVTNSTLTAAGHVTVGHDLTVAGTATFNSTSQFNNNIQLTSTAFNIDFMETGVTDQNHRIRQNSGNLSFGKLTDDKNTFTENMLLDGGAGTIFNNGGAAAFDFRVASDTNTHMLFLDASANTIGIGTSNMNVIGNNVAGINFLSDGMIGHTRDGGTVLKINRKQDGVLAEFYSAAGLEGTISISGSTTSYNGFSGLHESSGISTSTPVGTVVSTIDELDVYPSKQGSGNEQEPHPKAGQTRTDHAKVKVSDAAGDACVYGVVGSFNDQDKVNVVSVGIGSVRVTGACSKGDLLESNGDGTAKVQSDDIVRSKTLGKVTIGNNNTGVKLVSCVMYCG